MWVGGVNGREREVMRMGTGMGKIPGRAEDKAVEWMVGGGRFEVVDDVGDGGGGGRARDGMLKIERLHP